MLKQPDPKELQSRIETAQALYRDRKSGINLHAEVGAHGQPIVKMIDGGVETFLVPNAFEVLPVYLEAMALGNTLHPMGLVQTGLDQYGGATFELYTYKPEAVTKAALEQIAQDEAAKYHAEVEQHNELFIQAQVDAQLKVDRAREERDLAKAEAERRAAVERQIRETFKPTEAAPVPAPTKGKRS
jgi:hypothetical protein